MADVSSNNGNERQVVKNHRAKRSRIFMDMTPMVDLAFLLLTFFMLANSFQNQKVIKVLMPQQNTDSAHVVNESKVLTLYPQPGEKLYYRYGTDKKIQLATYNDLSSLLSPYSGKKDPWVFIKSDDKASYGELVRVFDALRRANIINYSLADRDGSEKAQLAQL